MGITGEGQAGGYGVGEVGVTGGKCVCNNEKRSNHSSAGNSEERKPAALFKGGRPKSPRVVPADWFPC